MTALSLECFCQDSDRMYFGDNVPNLRYLSLRNHYLLHEHDDVYANIKIGLPNLRALVLEVDGRLELEVDDLSATGARLEAFFLEWGCLRPWMTYALRGKNTVNWVSWNVPDFLIF